MRWRPSRGCGRRRVCAFRSDRREHLRLPRGHGITRASLPSASRIDTRTPGSSQPATGRCSSASMVSPIRKIWAPCAGAPRVPERAVWWCRSVARRGSRPRCAVPRPVRSSTCRLRWWSISPAFWARSNAAICRVLAAERSAATTLWATDLAGGSALVFGAEGSGLRPGVRRVCDDSLAIPLAGAVESLNVSVACGIVLFEAARQRRARA